MLGIIESNASLLASASNAVKENNIKFFLASFSDLQGSVKAKLVPSMHLQSVCENGAGFAGFAVGDLGHTPQDPDILCIPDLRSMIILPWKKDFAWFAGTLTEDGTSAWPYCSRTILLQVLEKAKKMGFTMMTGVEPEFFLLKKNELGKLSPSDDKDSDVKPCYGQQALMRNAEFLGTLIGYMNELGWGVYQADHEDANGQFEINWNYSDVLISADRHSFFKYMVRSMAEERGLIATFMPKPFSHLTGNGCHMHISLWDKSGKTNLFKSEDDARGLGLSPIAYYFIGGLLRHARACSAIIAPSVNSYKRLTARSSASGATWAPNCITYGGNNRTQFIRVPASGRMEYRALDGACNPYLAAAVILAAGLDGIEHEIDPGQPFGRNGAGSSYEEKKIETLPTNLKEAIEALEQNEVILSALGSEFAQTFIQRKKEEWAEYHSHISAWEVDRYLTGA